MVNVKIAAPPLTKKPASGSSVAEARGELLEQLLESASWKAEQVRGATTQNLVGGGAGSQEDMVELACLFGAMTGGEDFHRAAAKHPQAPAKVLLWLASEGSEEVRIAVATNPRTPPQAFRILVEESLALPAVAQNPCAPVDVLEILARHWDPAVRRKVALNPNSPPDIRRNLLGNELPTEIFLP